MKEKKSRQLRVRLTESQLKMVIDHIVSNPEEYKNQSELIRESITEKICRKKDLNSKRGLNK